MTAEFMGFCGFLGAPKKQYSPYWLAGRLSVIGFAFATHVRAVDARPYWLVGRLGMIDFVVAFWARDAKAASPTYNALTSAACLLCNTTATNGKQKPTIILKS